MVNLLFIGTPQDSIPAMGRALALGYGVYAVDGNPSSPGLLWAKKWGLGADTADVYDFHWIHKTVLKNKWEVDGVLAVAVDVGPVVSLVALALGLPHIPYSTSKLSWDKVKLKRVLRAADIPVPGSARFVVKPVDGRGSRGVSIVNPSNLWGVEWKAAQQESPTGRVMCEEYIEGDGVSVEAVVYNGSIIFAGATDRIYTISKVVEIGGQAPTKYGASWFNCLCQVVAVIGLKTGTIKLDLIVKNGDERNPYVIEAAIGRLSGGLTCSHYLPLAYNVDFLAMAFAVYSGQDPRPLLSRPYLKTRHIPGRVDYFLSGRYDMPPNLSRNGDRRHFRLRLGRSREEAERKLNAV